MAEIPPLRMERHYGDRVVACHATRPANVHDLLAQSVARDPDRVAVVCGARRLSYAAFADETGRVAAGLADLGVGPGDRVAMLLGNGLTFLTVLYAAARLGAVTVPLSIREQMPGIRHALVNSGARALIAEAALTALVPAPGETPDLSARIAEGGVEGWSDYADLRASDRIAPAVDTPEEDPATILYTSGTTGTPKGAVLTGLGIVHSAGNFVSTMELGPDDTTVVTVPMNHVTGLVAGIHSLIHAGGTVVAMREFKAARFLELAAAERMTCSLMVPAMYNLCLHQTDLSDYDLGAWRVGGYGGAPMPAATIERLAQALPGLGLMNAYGATETTSPATIMPADQTAARRLSVGRPVPGAEILAMDDTGREVPRGTSGELWIRGAMVVPGYWRNPQADAREFAAGFWKSGDIGMIDADGYVHVLDRKKDMVNRGGHKIYTAQVESLLTAYPGVIEAAVVAKPCPVLGERVHAAVSVGPAGIDETALRDYCAARLADYQCPESYSIGAELLPRNANGKILKRDIRAALGFLDPPHPTEATDQ
ncbi:MAG: AMP-binding protein [Rhodobacteraceae bacterium]|nr:AMP-binding protein [Paracoccaceae bacterium]